MDFSTEGPGIRPPPLDNVPEELRRYRFDLLHLYTYLGRRKFADGLSENGIRRVLETGTGLDYEAINELVALNYFKPGDLVTADPEYTHLPIREQVGYALIPKAVEEIRSQITAYKLVPFDLVMSKGLISICNLVKANESLNDVIGPAVKLLSEMKQCLNPANPKALIMISAKHPGSLVPLPEGELERLGLRIVYYLESIEESVNESKGLGYMFRLKKAGIYSQKETPKELLICTRK